MVLDALDPIGRQVRRDSEGAGVPGMYRLGRVTEINDLTNLELPRGNISERLHGGLFGSALFRRAMRGSGPHCTPIGRPSATG